MGEKEKEDRQVCFLAVGDRCWGKGKTPNEAVKAAVKEGGREAVRHHQMYLVHPATTVTQMGSIRYSVRQPPTELYRVWYGKQYAAGTEKEDAVKPKTKSRR